MGSRFNVPNLFYVKVDGFNHIARTNIAGCRTECGILLNLGQPWTSTQPPHWCKACEERITHLAYPGRGLALDEKHQEWLHLKEFAP